MNRQQRRAVFLLVGFALNLIAGGLLAVVLPTDDPANVEFLGLGVYQIRAYGLWLAIFLVTIVLGELLFRKRPDDVVDERDQQISRDATVWATTVFWITFGLACGGLILIFGPLKISVPAIWVISPLIVGSLVAYVSAYSIAILIQYGRVGQE
jgi:uncharacterized membrane protein